jgi:hypothetical protein
MMRLVPSPEELPVGSHALAFYGTAPEAAHHMASFVKGARNLNQSAIVLSSDDRMLGLYREELAQVAPELTDSLRRIRGPHARPTPDGLRPVEEVVVFARAHPEGATMSGDTIPSFLNRQSLDSILAYEEWFDSLRPFLHRGLCPYDLAHIPIDRVPEAIGRLATAHSHGVLSQDPHPGIRFLQLLVLPHVENPPPEHLGWLAQAVDYGLIDHEEDDESAELTPRGETFARALMALPTFAQRATDTAGQRRRVPPRGDREPVAPGALLD